jgi:hypothetical protein
MRRALHLGIQKALGVVRSHYEVNFEAVASVYVVPEGVKDEAAMEQADALAVDAAEALTEAFTEFLIPDADEPQARRPLGARPIFVQVLVSRPHGHVNKQVKLMECSNTYKFKWCLLFVAPFCFFPLLV